MSLSKFFLKTRDERIAALSKLTGIPKKDLRIDGGITFDQADLMVENAIGTLSLPLGVATNFRINNKPYIIPMATEEPSIIAAASKSAKTIQNMEAGAADPISIGQILVRGAADDAASLVSARERTIIEAANLSSETLSRQGRGAKRITCRRLNADGEDLLVVELHVDVGDAMGANITNTMCEAVSGMVCKIAGGEAIIRILSNYSETRIAWARMAVPVTTLGVPLENMMSAYRFAKHDVYRAVTHNKGIMNGILAVAAATGQDTRAIDAAAHAYAARDGRYTSLTEWHADGQTLFGSIKLPLAVGTVGGITRVHRAAQACLSILGVGSARELAGVMAAVGLAQNFAAIRALAGEGIQKGHMRLHARNVAASAGVPPELVPAVAEQMSKENNITATRARELRAGTTDKIPPASHRIDD